MVPLRGGVGRREIAAALISALTASALLAAPTAAPAGGGKISVLLVASDVDDVAVGWSLAGRLNSLGWNVTVDILYLNEDYEGARGDRARLSDPLFLSGFDQFWLPDLNADRMAGGRLTDGELGTLLSKVREGRGVLLGLNTLTQHWSETMQELSGVTIVGLRRSGGAGGVGPGLSAAPGSGLPPGTEVWYNWSLGFAELSAPPGSEILASAPGGRPAVVLADVGRGYSVVCPLNFVAAYAQSDRADPLLDVLAAALSLGASGHSVEEVGPLERLAELVSSFDPTNPVHLAVSAGLAYAALLDAAVLGVLPYELTRLVFLPLRRVVCRVMSGREATRRILELIMRRPGVDAREVSSEVGVGRPTPLLAAIEVCGAASSARLPGWGGRRRVWFRPEDRELALALNLAADPVTWRLIGFYLGNPGSTPKEAAVELGIPLERAVTLTRWLADVGAVRLSPLTEGYAVHPGPAARRAAGAGGGG